MFCPNCNCKLADNVQFCPVCGTRLTAPDRNDKGLGITGLIVALSVLLTLSVGLFFAGRWELRHMHRMLGIVMEVPAEREEASLESPVQTEDIMPTEAMPAETEPVEDLLAELHAAVMFSDGSDAQRIPMDYIIDQLSRTTPYLGVHDPGGDPYGQIELLKLLYEEGNELIIVRPAEEWVVEEMALISAEYGMPIIFVYAHEHPGLQELNPLATIIDGNDLDAVAAQVVNVVTQLVEEGWMPEYVLCGAPSAETEIYTPEYVPNPGEPFAAIILDSGVPDAAETGEYLRSFLEEGGYYCDTLAVIAGVEEQFEYLIAMLESGHNVIFMDAVDPVTVAEMTELCRSFDAILILMNTYDGDIMDYEKAASVFVERGGYTLASTAYAVMEQMIAGYVKGPVYYNY